jgi:hypothetical protein
MAANHVEIGKITGDSVAWVSNFVDMPVSFRLRSTFFRAACLPVYIPPKMAFLVKFGLLVVCNFLAAPLDISVALSFRQRIGAP